MLKFTFSFFIVIFLTNSAFCQKADTTVWYFKYFDGVAATVSSLDEADFFRLVLPPDPGDNRHNIKEYYKNGKIKLVGKIYTGPNSLGPTGGIIKFDGDCVSFYPSGKKMSVTHYAGGFKDGLEYIFYPWVKIYCTLKYSVANKVKNNGLRWECYDKDDNVLCQDGNGKWIEYENNYANVGQEGFVKHGNMDGEWHGELFNPDTIKYMFKYNNGVLVSSTGYDREGNAYPFKEEQERAAYKHSPLSFVEMLRNHIKLPRDNNGKKMSLDTLHVSFVIEKNGHIDQFEMAGDVNTQLKDAVFTALVQFDGWSPRKFYGGPFRTQITVPLKEKSGYNSYGYREEIFYQEKIIK